MGNMQTNADAGQPQTLADRIFPLMLEEHRLLRKVGEDHPQVKDIREQIEFTRGFTEGLVVDSEATPRRTSARLPRHLRRFAVAANQNQRGSGGRTE